jgi:hypothetical protein
MLTVTLGDEDSTLPESSAARVVMVDVGEP